MGGDGGCCRRGWRRRQHQASAGCAEEQDAKGRFIAKKDAGVQ